jgi:hypothetical protein
MYTCRIDKRWYTAAALHMVTVDICPTGVRMLVYRLRTNWRQGLKQADDSLLYFGFCSHCFPVTSFLRGKKSLKSLGTRSRPILSKPEKYLCHWKTNAQVSMVLPICHVYVKFRIEFSASQRCLPYFVPFCIRYFMLTIRCTKVLSRKVGHTHLVFGHTATPDEAFETVSASFYGDSSWAIFSFERNQFISYEYGVDSKIWIIFKKYDVVRIISRRNCAGARLLNYTYSVMLTLS